MSDLQVDPEDCPIQISLKVEEEVQIRHGSLKSAHLSANRLILKHAGEKQYKMILRKSPHHAIRKNKQTIGVGAGRISDGMRQSFGEAIETIVRISKGETMFTIYCDVEGAETVKGAFRRTYNKMSPPYHTVVNRGKELLVT